MEKIQQAFTINYFYSTYFTKALFDSSNALLKNLFSNELDLGSGKFLVVMDKGLCDAQPNLSEQVESYFSDWNTATLLCPPLVFPGGEAIKNDQSHLYHLLKVMDEKGLCRHSYVLAIGGGALLDMVGFACAIAHRGVRHIRIPSTVLSQNDSGVGVKNGINFLGKKNFLGAFAPPQAVINDLALLSSLEDRDWRSGIAEAIKVALIKDKKFFSWMEEHCEELNARNSDAIHYLIYRCAALHLEHIASGDPFESGSSRPLDFGHWSAHKLEQLSDFSLRHGEAVAMGIALDCQYAMQALALPPADLERILKVLITLGFEIFHPSMQWVEKNANWPLWEGLQEFKEHLGGELTIAMLKEIGSMHEVHTVDKTLLLQAVKQLKLVQQQSSSLKA